MSPRFGSPLAVSRIDGPSMRLLLINPRFPESFWSFKWAMDTVVNGRKTINPPLGLATLAALCPPDWEITICDENIETLPLAPEADIVGICGMGVQFSRQRELLAYYRNRGYYVVAGGSYASLCPEEYVNIADTVVAGEAEYIWKEFCRDYPEGKQRTLYQETGSVSLVDSPVPRFDLLKLDRYQAVSLQFSRGCPFRCEFCDIIVMFGRVPRTKPVEQVGRELDELRKLGVHNAFFVDDNLIGNKRTAKELLRYLKEYQDQKNYHFRFGTEASLNLAQDKELLDLFSRREWNGSSSASSRPTRPAWWKPRSCRTPGRTFSPRSGRSTRPGSTSSPGSSSGSTTTPSRRSSGSTSSSPSPASRPR